MKDIKLFEASDVERLLSVDKCNELMEKVFIDEETGACNQYLRHVVLMPNKNIMAAMPGYFDDGYFGMKILSVYPFNSKEGYPSHQGVVVVFDEKHGELQGIVDAMSITGIRTGCCSAIASKYLARKDSKVLSIIGCGHQGYAHIKALSTIYDFETIKIFDQRDETSIALKVRIKDEMGIDVDICSSIKECVEDADIICTLTQAKEPIIEKDWVKQGAHINAVGACTKDAREIPSDLVKDSKFFCDNVTSVENESGDYLLACADGSIDATHILGTIGQVINNKVKGRESDEDITIFESLGMAVEDLICAKYIISMED